MRTTRRRVGRWAVAALCLGLLAGCDGLPGGYTPIRDIVAAPDKFEGQTVKVKGKVTDVLRVPLIDIRAFTLKDEGGEITVMTTRSLPALNDEVALRGKVVSAAIVGGLSLGLRIEESERLR